MLINVTQENIRDGVRRSSCYCPVANAIKDVLKSGCKPSVGTTVYSLLDGRVWALKRNPLPPEVESKIRRYDRGVTIEPFSFELDIPKEFLKEVPVG